MKKKFLVTVFAVVSLFLFFSRKIEATIGLPFSPGETWYVCRGYNQGSHNGPALDFSVDSNSSSENGCWAGSNASTGKSVRAPEGGTVKWYLSDMLCLSLDSGKSLLLGHFGYRAPEGHVVGNSIVGTLSTPGSSPNGGYAHIHIQAHSAPGCSSGTLVPFNDANGTKLEDAENMHNDNIYNQWAYRKTGKSFTKPASSTWHPNGTLIRAAGDDAVYYLQNGKRRGLTSPQALTNNGY